MMSSGQGSGKEGGTGLKRPIDVYSSLFSLSLRGFGGGKEWAEKGVCGGPRTRVCRAMLRRANLKPGVITFRMGVSPTSGHVSVFVSLGFTHSLGFLKISFRPFLYLG